MTHSPGRWDSFFIYGTIKSTAYTPALEDSAIVSFSPTGLYVGAINSTSLWEAFVRLVFHVIPDCFHLNAPQEPATVHTQGNPLTLRCIGHPMHSRVSCGQFIQEYVQLLLYGPLWLTLTVKCCFHMYAKILTGNTTKYFPDIAQQRPLPQVSIYHEHSTKMWAFSFV